MKFKLLVVLSLVFFASCKTPIETTVVPIRIDEWRIGHAVDHGAGKGTLMEWIPKGQEIEAWRQLVTIQYFDNLAGRDAADFSKALFGMQQAKYGVSVDHKVLESSDWSCLFEWTIQGHEEHEDQHELVRLIEGDKGLHRVAYAHKGGRMPADTRTRWIDLLRKAYVEFKGAPIRPQPDRDDAN